MSKMDEMIVVAPREVVFAAEALAFHGFRALAERGSQDVLDGLCGSTRLGRRGDVEEDFDLLQPIPYIVVTRTVGDHHEVFAYTRLAGGGERRLHGRVSIGVGGHMNRPFNRASLRHVVEEEATRELCEELSFEDGDGGETRPAPARLIGLINDDTGEVQRVHIGLLAVVEVPASWRVLVRETDRLEGHWVSIDDLRNDEARARLEEWSVHALAGLQF